MPAEGARVGIGCAVLDLTVLARCQGTALGVVELAGWFDKPEYRQQPSKKTEYEPSDGNVMLKVLPE